MKKQNNIAANSLERINNSIDVEIKWLKAHNMDTAVEFLQKLKVQSLSELENLK